MKKIYTIIFTLLLIFNISSICFSAPYITLNLNYDGTNHNYNAEEVYLYVNSQKLSNLSMPPIILNNYTLVPARDVFETLGATVNWDNDSMEVEIIYEDNFVNLQINSKTAYVNNVSKTMDIPAKLINNKTMIPVRFVSEAIGADIEWDNNTRSIYISTNEVVEDKVDGNLTNIIDFKLPDSDQNHFKITLDKEIDEFIESYDGKEYTIKIENSNYTLEKTYFSSVVTSIDSTSVTVEDNTTIFSFLTNEELDFNTFISNDKKSIFITFGSNFIKNIELFAENDTEILKLNSEYELAMDIKNDTENNKIIIDLENCGIKNLSENLNYSNLIKNVKYYQYSESLVKVEISFVENISNIEFSVNISDNTSFITFSNSEDKELEYSSYENRITLKNYNSSIDINDIIHTDNYLDNQYILTFKNDISNSLDLGTYNINTDLVNNIEVSKNQIIINSNKIIAVNITSSNDLIYIDIVEPKEKYDNIIVLDAGHGGSDSGATDNNLFEKNITLDIVNKAVALFEKNSNIKVYATRTTDVYPTFDDRTSLANEVGDIFISVHINAASNNTNAKGTEVYYLNENTNDSGLTSSFLASTMQESLIKTLGTYDRKIKTSNFKVLRDTYIPCILSEIAFITNPEDAANLATDSFRQKVAQAIYDACIKVFELYPSR